MVKFDVQGTHMQTFIMFCFSFLVLVCSSGCTSTYFFSASQHSLQDIRLNAHHRVERHATWTVSPLSTVFLSRPVDIEQHTRVRSISQLYSALDHAIQQVFPAYTTDNNVATLNQALQKAEDNGSELLFWPKLISLEHKLNDKQELIEGRSLHPSLEYGPDRIVFQVQIYEVDTQRLLDVATVISRSAMFASPNTLPDDLLYKAVEEYISAITGKLVG